MNAEEQAATEKLAKVAQQVNAVCDDAAFTIECPYCGKISIQDGNFCCFTLKKAVKAVLDARERFIQVPVRTMVN